MTVFKASEDFKILLGSNIIGGLDVTNEGGITISWTQGIVYDASNDINRNILASASFTTFSIDASGNTITFNQSAKTISRASGSWIIDGLSVGDLFVVVNSTNNNTLGSLQIASLSATVITITNDLLTDETNTTLTIVFQPHTILLDADDSFLVWETGDSVLKIRAATPTGNDVLIATITTAGGDITSIVIAGFDPTGITGISVRPTIRLLGDDDPSFYSEGGKITINDENLVRIDDKVQFRDEFYRILVDLIFDGSNSSTIKNIMTEIDDKIKTNNALATREYYYKLSYVWNGNYRLGIMLIAVDAIREMVGL